MIVPALKVQGDCACRRPCRLTSPSPDRANSSLSCCPPSGADDDAAAKSAFGGDSCEMSSEGRLAAGAAVLVNCTTNPDARAASGWPQPRTLGGSTETGAGATSRATPARGTQTISPRGKGTPRLGGPRRRRVSGPALAGEDGSPSSGEGSAITASPCAGQRH